MTLAKDPYKYFRIEAQELVDGLSQGLLELERSPSPQDVVRRLLRLAHTLKGAARVVKQAGMANQAHALEDLLAAVRDGATTVTREMVEAELKLVDGLRQELALLAPAPAPPPAAATSSTTPAPVTPALPLAPSTDTRAPFAPERFDSVRVEASALDGMMESVAELGVRLGALGPPTERTQQALDEARLLLAVLRHPTPQIERAESMAAGLVTTLSGLCEALSGAMHGAKVGLDDVAKGAEALRLVPVSGLLDTLHRQVRDAAQAVDRLVDFRAVGGDVRLDANVLAGVKDALVHVVRNAVAHGIEDARTRSAAGKPPSGTVQVRVERRGSRVVFLCEDDGQGIDTEALAQAARAKGLLRANESPGHHALLELVFQPGLSTSKEVTSLSGRGVGMDVVRTVVEALKGDVSLESRRGAGTSIALSVPVTLSTMPLLFVEAGPVQVGVPLDSLAQALRVPAESAGTHLEVEGRPHRFVPLQQLVAPRRPLARRKSWTVLLVRSGPELVALGIDRIVRAETVLLRPLPPLAGPLPLLLGSAIQSDGTPIPVLDPRALASRVQTGAGPQAPAPAPVRPPVLVIDDSLTTRMLEQSILESAGYEVDVACSAEEGWEKALGKRYGLFVVDVDMPGMSGFEFVAQSRAHDALGKVPAILVTSRNSAEDKQRGRDAGASGYVVKGEFDQTVLLQKIRGLIG